MTRPIFFLSDFGLADTYVGIVKAVILGIAPDARIVDLTHDVPAQDIRAGAYALLTAAPYLPAEAVVLAVVDPGVGTARRPIAVEADGRSYVGPDNGLLSWAVRAALTPRPPGMALTPRHPGAALTPRPPLPCAEEGEQRGASEGERVVALDRSGYWLPSVSSTFHGRDLFGPVAAHLARGLPIHEVGSPAAAMVTIPFPMASRDLDGDGRVVRASGEVIHVDRFGNLIATLTASDLPPDPTIEVAGRRIVGLAATFQAPGPTNDEGGPIALIGSAGLLEIAVPNGSAAMLLGRGVGTPVTVSARSPGQDRAHPDAVPPSRSDD
jgi:S-adenosylmethionine hydrolase